MGKYAMTRSRSAYATNSRTIYGSSSINNDGWNKVAYLFGDLDIFGVKPFQLYDKYNYMNDYLRNRHMSWSDMKYPSIASQHGGARFVVSEKSLKRLYS